MANAPLLTCGVVICVLGHASGCILLPSRMDSHQDDGTHRRIDWPTYLALDTGRMNRDQVKTALGRRDVELADGRLWIYSWETRGELGLFILAFWGEGAGSGEILMDSSKAHYLILEFDGASVLQRKEVRHGGTLNGLAKGWDDVMIK